MKKLRDAWERKFVENKRDPEAHKRWQDERYGLTQDQIRDTYAKQRHPRAGEVTWTGEIKDGAGFYLQPYPNTNTASGGSITISTNTNTATTNGYQYLVSLYEGK